MTCKEKILSNEYEDIIIDFSMPREWLELMQYDYCFRDLDGGFNIAYVESQRLPQLSIGMYTYAFLPKLYGLMQAFQADNLVDIGNLRIQYPPLSLQGNGVMIGFIDTGIRYQLDAFRDAEGNSRILSIWDQTIQAGEPPEGFLYGTEYTREQINEALRADNPRDIVPSTDENGHGTAMTSAAAGSVIGEGLTFRGAAPQADIAVVKLKQAKPYLRDFFAVAGDADAYQENDIMEAVKYLDRMASVLRRPIVIVLGIGTNMGNHTGSSPLATYLNSIASKKGRSVVVCGGNEGDKEHHYSGNVPEQVEIQVAENTRGFCMELWGDRVDSYSVTIRAPGGEVTTEISPRSGLDREISFLFDKTEIYVGIALVEQRSGEELFFFRFRNPSPGIWSIMISTENQARVRGTGSFHMWLPITEFIDGAVRFLEPDPEVTLTEPSNAEQVFTISTYNGQNGSWFFESGRGFAGNGIVKPDLAAPGVEVSTALGPRTGSSMAAALSAGCVAQFLEWAVIEENAPYMGNRAIKSYFIRGATREENLDFPDERWGYGKLNVTGLFETLARI